MNMVKVLVHSLSAPNLSQDYKYMYIKSIDQIFFFLIGDIL